jgi:surface polysaccharide O-acyltransferase-like enzyme
VAAPNYACFGCRRLDASLYFRQHEIRRKNILGGTSAFFMSRIKSLDALKGFAILAVIFLHSVRPESVPVMSLPAQIVHELCRIAVPCFFLIGGFFFMRAWRKNPDHAAFAWHYAKRLLKPFLFWALFYAIVPPFVDGSPDGIGAKILNHLMSIVRFPHHFLLTGDVYHLWFLSSMLQAAGIVWVALRLGHLRIALLLGAVFYCAALLGESYSQTALGFHTHFDMMNGPFVSTLFFAIGAWLAERRQNLPLVVGAALLGGGLLTCLAEEALLHYKFALPIAGIGPLFGTVPYAAGAVVMALALPNCGGVMAKFGAYSLGIYTFHPYVMEVLLRVSFGRAVSCSPILFSLLAFVITFAAISLLSRIRWMRPFTV